MMNNPDLIDEHAALKDYKNLVNLMEWIKEIGGNNIAYKGERCHLLAVRLEHYYEGSKAVLYASTPYTLAPIEITADKTVHLEVWV